MLGYTTSGLGQLDCHPNPFLECNAGASPSASRPSFGLLHAKNHHAIVSVESLDASKVAMQLLPAAWLSPRSPQPLSKGCSISRATQPAGSHHRSPPLSLLSQHTQTATDTSNDDSNPCKRAQSKDDVITLVPAFPRSRCRA